jgi:hypothetical protein
MEEVKVLKLKNSENVPSNYTGCVEHENGTKNWFKKGKFHRLDGPAIEYATGTKFWYVEDKFIRSQHGIFLIPSKVYKLTGEISGINFVLNPNSNNSQFCLALENREQKEGRTTYFISKVLLNNKIVELVFSNKTFEELG